MHEYYYKNRKKYEKDLKKFINKLRNDIEKKFGREKYGIIESEIMKEFGNILENLEYIGGKENSLTNYLIQTSWSISMYRVFTKHGISSEEVGDFIKKAIEIKIFGIPVIIRKFFGKYLLFNKRKLAIMKKRSKESQNKKYKADWVWDVNYDSEKDTYFINYYECGIVKLLKKENAMDIASFLCYTDYVSLGGFGYDLKRKHTIAEGCDRCDFIIKYSGKILEK